MLTYNNVRMVETFQNKFTAEVHCQCDLLVELNEHLHSFSLQRIINISLKHCVHSLEKNPIRSDILLVLRCVRLYVCAYMCVSCVLCMCVCDSQPSYAVFCRVSILLS